MLYGYLCALRPKERTARVQIHSRTLRHERERWGRDRLDAVLGGVVARTSSCEMLLEPGGLEVRTLAPLLRKVGEPILEVNNDHFPTAVFQRRIVEVLDPGGERCLALEEDMSLLRLEPIRSTRKVPVACIVDEDRFRALDRVLDATGFDALLESKLSGSGKARPAFSIVIKPNFMFAYDRRDRSTYTDPALVHRLVARLRAAGFEDVKVAEAQSTYGEYFDRRSVREMADCLGYDGSPGYQVVDMTLDADERRYLGPHLGDHPVSRAWREADFRVSFAKNKTHAYAFYTLTLKNIHGALPLANKFQEYHCKRGIYATAIEYLAAFPVDYGLVDAVLSADGPFGIFADPAPNETRTVIGGSDLVAVDWVGASKMGIDPMISPYMKLAVEDGRDALPAQEQVPPRPASPEAHGSAAPHVLPAHRGGSIALEPVLQLALLRDGVLIQPGHRAIDPVDTALRRTRSRGRLVLTGCHANDGLESAYEVALVGEAYGGRDIARGDPPREQGSCGVDPDLCQVLVRRQCEAALECFDELASPKTRHLRQAGERARVAEMGVEVLARAFQRERRRIWQRHSRGGAGEPAERPADHHLEQRLSLQDVLAPLQRVVQTPERAGESRVLAEAVAEVERPNRRSSVQQVL